MPGGLFPPLSISQSWPAPNYNDPVTQGTALIDLAIVLYAIALITILARLWARVVVRYDVGLDDVLVVVAMIPLTGLAIATGLAYRSYGYGRHVWDLPTQMAADSRKITMILEIVYIAATGLTKISILLFYRRIIDMSISKRLKWAARASILFVIMYMGTWIPAILLSCRPFESYWLAVNLDWRKMNVRGVDWQCYNEGVSTAVANAVSIIQDFLTCSIPMFIFWSLQMPRQQKIALAILFGIGYFLCFAGILRFVYMYQAFFDTYDVTWVEYKATLWTIIEAEIAVVCASAPALRAFFGGYFKTNAIEPRRLSYMYRRTGYERSAHCKSTQLLGISTSACGVEHSDKMNKTAQIDVETGGIEVTKEVDVNSVEGSARDWAREHCSERYGFCMPEAHMKKKISNEIPWLDLSDSEDTTPNFSRPVRK